MSEMKQRRPILLACLLAGFTCFVLEVNGMPRPLAIVIALLIGGWVYFHPFVRPGGE